MSDKPTLFVRVTVRVKITIMPTTSWASNMWVFFFFFPILGYPWNKGISVPKGRWGLRWLKKPTPHEELISGAVWICPKKFCFAEACKVICVCVCVYTFALGASPYIELKAASHPWSFSCPPEHSASGVDPSFTWPSFRSLAKVMVSVFPSPPAVPPPPASVCHFWEAWRGVFIHSCLGKFHGF